MIGQKEIASPSQPIRCKSTANATRSLTFLQTSRCLRCTTPFEFSSVSCDIKYFGITSRFNLFRFYNTHLKGTPTIIKSTANHLLMFYHEFTPAMSNLQNENTRSLPMHLKPKGWGISCYVNLRFATFFIAVVVADYSEFLLGHSERVLLQLLRNGCWWRLDTTIMIGR